MTTEDIIAAAAMKADRINDLMKVHSEVIRRHNRMTWAALDLQDAGEWEAMWGPLVDEAYRILREAKEAIP